MQIFHEFYDICYSFTLLISYNMVLTFNPFKMAVQFFWTASSLPNIDGPNAVSHVQQAPGLDIKRVGKSLN